MIFKVDDATDYRLSYIYDNFRWEHCTQFGYPSNLFPDGYSDDTDDSHYDDDANSMTQADDGGYTAESADDAEK